MKNILDEAIDVVSARSDDYGDPLDIFTRVAALWNVLFRDLLGSGKVITPSHVAIAMIAFKLAREVHKHKRDNIVDIAGYAWVLGEVSEEGES